MVIKAFKKSHKKSQEIRLSLKSQENFIEVATMSQFYYGPKLIHVLLGDDEDRCLQFFEIGLNEQREENGVVMKTL